MQDLLEKPPVVDQTELATATVEAVTDFLKATAETPPALAAPQPVLTEAQVIAGYCPPGGYEYATWQKTGKTAWQHKVWKTMTKGQQKLVEIPAPQGDTPGQALLEASGTWCNPGPWGVAGTGQDDVAVDFPAKGPVLITEVADFLDYAAERIIRFGWVRGVERYAMYVCSVGALRVRQEQLIPHMGESRAAKLAEQACGVLTSYLYRHKGNMVGIMGWNDAEGRTMGEVITAFREAAAELRGVSAPRIRRALLV